jgi:hypothetical protein
MAKQIVEQESIRQSLIQYMEQRNLPYRVIAEAVGVDTSTIHRFVTSDICLRYEGFQKLKKFIENPNGKTDQAISELNLEQKRRSLEKLLGGGRVGAIKLPDEPKPSMLRDIFQAVGKMGRTACISVEKENDQIINTKIQSPAFEIDDESGVCVIDLENPETLREIYGLSTYNNCHVKIKRMADLEHPSKKTFEVKIEPIRFESLQ